MPLILKLAFLCFICSVMTILSSHVYARSSYTVALVDRFYPGDLSFYSENERQLNIALYGMLDLDQDGLKEPMYHGDIVKKILMHPDIKIVPYELESEVLPIKALLRQLEVIRRDIFWEMPIDAVLLPWESSTLVSSFDESLDAEDVDYYLDKLRSWAIQDTTWQVTIEIIQVLEDIVDYGGTVYTIAGNGGARMINTYSFAEGVTTIGASEAELDHFVADNVFVDDYAPAAYTPEKLIDSSGIAVGYDLDGDSCRDIELSDLSSAANLPKRHWKPLLGSSFAAPAALKRYLLGYSSHLDCP